MPKVILRCLQGLVLVSLLAMMLYYLLAMHSPAPDRGDGYVLNVELLRQAAQSLPGSRPHEIRVEQVAEFRFPENFVMAGEPWQYTPIGVFAYQLVFADDYMIVDTALASMKGMPEFVVTSFDNDAYQRVSKALEGASQIVITHEHVDHIGGLLSHPRLADLLPAVRMTRTQMKNSERMRPLKFPEEIFREYEALDYDGHLAVAPGVVLIQSPGHTPGSQMVYVQTEDGREVLLLGDVTWQQRNIDQVRARSWMTTIVNREDRQQVVNQLKTLNELRKTYPKLRQMPGHDVEVMSEFCEAGIFTEGFLK